LQITESSRDGTEFTSAANTEHSGQSDFIFSASTSKHGTLQLQRRHNKKKGGGMSYHANSTQNLPSSAIGLAHSEVASRQCVDSAAQWTEYTKMEPSRVTISRGAEFTKKENFEHHEDCETWRLRCLHDVLLSLPFSYLASNLVVENLQNYFEISGDRRILDQNLGGCLDFYR
jgi:DnaJ family protein C protein 7